MNFIEAGRVRIARTAMLTLVAGLMGLAPAAAAVDSEAVRSACTSDAFRLCSNTMPDVARTRACLASHRGSLSPTCRAGLSGGGRGGTTRHRHHTRHH
jgi:hypothetical protein